MPVISRYLATFVTNISPLRIFMMSLSTIYNIKKHTMRETTAPDPMIYMGMLDSTRETGMPILIFCISTI